MNRVQLQIEGNELRALCEVRCARHLIPSTVSRPGVSVSVGHADLTFDPARTNASEIVASVKKAGYDAHIVAADAR